MGCCCSAEENGLLQDGDQNERTRLLNDPVSENYQVNTRANEHSTYGSSAPQKSDEQSALNRILQQTVSNVIDVGALECHTLEQHEYIDRVRTYNQKLHILPVSKILTRPNNGVLLLTDVPVSERILSAQPITYSDLNLIITSTQKAMAALGQLKVEHKEDLVVPFGIP